MPTTGTRTATIATNFGTVQLELDTASAPCTVRSWEHLSNAHFYDSTNCHRLAGAMLQCGDPFGTGYGRPAYEYRAENLPGPAVYPRGAVAMAQNASGTVGSQFLIFGADTELEPTSPVVGTVTAGMEVIDQIVALGHDGSMENTVGGGRPNREVRILSVRVN